LINGWKTVFGNCLLDAARTAGNPCKAGSLAAVRDPYRHTTGSECNRRAQKESKTEAAYGVAQAAGCLWQMVEMTTDDAT